MVPIISLFMVVTISILITRIATVALTQTGLARESAKFQARSAFTGVGFTTSESEKVVNHPVRRRILLLLMLLGNAGVVTAVSSLIISFVNLNQTDHLWLKMVLLVSGLVLLWSLAASKWLDQRLSALISSFLHQHTQLQAHDFSKLLHLAGEYQITELFIGNDSWMADKTIGTLGLRNEGLIVLGVVRRDGSYIGAPDGRTLLSPDDTVIIYGRAGGIADLDRRKDDDVGREGHLFHKAEHQLLKEKEQENSSQQPTS